MAGYSRQSAASIVPTAVVRATPLNDEFNTLRDAFIVASGHKHDGTATEGAYVPLISDTNSRNKVVVDQTNNRVGVFANVSSSAVEQVRFADGVIVPVVDNDIDLGSSTFEFKDLYIDGTANIDSLIADTASILAGTINNTVIGGTTPLAITGTTITATTGFVGSLSGTLNGNVNATTGSSTFNNVTVNGTLTSNLSGNVTATTGTSTFNNVTVTGTLNMDAGTVGTITNLATPTNANDAATKGYVDTSISNLINSSPATLDTLNELAAALGNDANFSTTVTNSIATKLSLSGGTMTGAIAMGTNKITGMGDPTNAQDAATKTYVDTQRDTRLALSGGTMSGAIAMGNSKITGLGTPTASADATTKAYVDGILGSATSAAASAAAAATSASNAATSASNASTSESNAAASASAAAASYDSFDDRYLGPKTSNPAVDNDGNALLTGALYFNSVAGEMRVWTGSAWLAAYLPAASYVTLTDTQTLTNKTISVDNNTISGIAASSFVLSNASGNIDGAVAQKVIPTGDVVGTTDSQTLTNKTISVDNNTISGIAASSFVLSNASGNIDGAVAQKAIPSGDVAGTTDTQTLTNKRINPRVSTATSAASLTPDISAFDQYNFTALAADLTINAPTGTPVDGTKLIIRILDNGTTRNLVWNATYTAVGVILPTATTASKITYIGCIYNSTNTRWDVIAVATQA